jgi:hypothetical protein
MIAVNIDPIAYALKALFLSVDGGVGMLKDRIVDEVRGARLEIEKECDGDFDQIYQRALEVQKKTTSKLISLPS